MGARESVSEQRTRVLILLRIFLRAYQFLMISSRRDKHLSCSGDCQVNWTESFQLTSFQVEATQPHENLSGPNLQCRYRLGLDTNSGDSSFAVRERRGGFRHTAKAISQTKSELSVTVFAALSYQLNISAEELAQIC
jgi:hypothetical protein